MIAGSNAPGYLSNMKCSMYKAGYISVIGMLFVLSCFGCKSQAEDDMLADEHVLSLPITDRKLVIAHCMTNITRYKGHKFEDSCDPMYFSPSEPATAPLGGLTQVLPLADTFLVDKTLEEAVAFEMKAAIASGIDGFQFYYTLNNDSWDDIIKAYFKVAEEKKLDFKFTFCISHPSGGTEDSRINGFGGRMKNILETVGRNNRHWLRTPDGRLVLYTWYGEGLANTTIDLKGRPSQYYMARAYHKLEKVTGEKFACVVSINEQISKEKLNVYLDYFPAVWIWTLPYTNDFIGNMVAEECRRRGRTFTGSAFSDFYTSKLLKKGTWDMFHSAKDAAAAGINAVERKYIVTGLSYNFRKQLEFSIKTEAPLINIITWNDYPEGHHLAPEINHNDGFGLLLNYYKKLWLKESAPFQKDIVIVFYKKYNHNTQPRPFNIPVVEIEKRGIDIKVEDSVEVVTILKEKGSITLNNQTREVLPGLQSTRFAGLPGPVSVTLRRNDRVIETVNSPEWITSQPYRTDRITYSFSNCTQDFYRDLFGTLPAVSFSEYNPGDPRNHIYYYNNK